MKRLWVSIKRGFIREPKHRLAVGECVWLFEYMLDIADWDTGIIHDWKDEAAADDMQMPLRTLREQRRKLDDLHYITCTQKQYTQDIAIHNWTNPRDYTGEVLNKKQGYVSTEPQDYTQDYTQGSTQDGTPTSNPKNQTSNKNARALSPAELEQANGKVTAIIEAARHKSYPNRDKIPEPYLAYCDAYVRLTGQEPRKSVLSDWLMEFSEWESAGLSAKNISDAFEKSREGHWMVTRPGSLTKTALALKGAERASGVDPLAPFRYERDEDGRIQASKKVWTPEELARIQ
jgi:hypothetical protein